MARAKALLANDPLRRWTAADANDTYNIPRWGCGYFSVNDQGNLAVSPGPEGMPGSIDMKELVAELTARGIQLPILLRFSDILRSRIEQLCGAFNGAIEEYGYTGCYRGVYPIKVNQNRTVVEEIIEFGRPFHYGLEAGRMFVELYKMGASSLAYFDVGGGLGVDYDGSQTNFASSMNYTVQEYANDVVYAVKEMCDADNVPHPNIVSESGRAITAHHSVLVVNVLGVTEFNTHVPKELPKTAPPLVLNMWETFQGASTKNLLEAYHDAVEYKDQVLQLFNLGHLSLENRVLCENLFWATCEKILLMVRNQPHVPEELEGLEKALSDTYFCNFSMFQSVPDAWAVDQLFPICPIHRLNEEPTHRATLADITCDSDGKIDSFIDLRDVKHVLELHPKSEGQDYYLGIFLVGAYQEILGDLHNLFGDTNTVHVQLSPEGEYDVKEVVAGDTVSEVLAFVDYSPSDLLGRLRNSVEAALRKKLMTIEESRTLINRFRQGMIGYTYLDRE
jgi:arginine decarboxylase